MATLSLTAATKRFVGPDGQPFAALDALTLTLPDTFGRVVIAGPDGAGKSTLLRVLAGLMALDEGRAELLGRAPGDAALAHRVGFMPQRFGLYEELTIEENLIAFAQLKGVPRAERAALFRDLLTLTGLAGFEDRRAGALSGGMKQKLGLCAALLATPEVLLLDEPTVGVDPLSRQELLGILTKRARTHGMRTVMTSSNLPEAEDADWVVLMAHGKILRVDTPETLRTEVRQRTFHLAHPKGESQALIRRLIFAVRAELGDVAPFIDVTPAGNGVNVLTPTPMTPERLEEALHPWLDTWALGKLDIRPRTPTMEDVYGAATLMATEPTQDTVPAIAKLPSETVIETQALKKTFGSFTAVEATSFSVKTGEIFGLLGPNGAGKTTTFRMLCGLLPATSGTIRIAGMTLSEAKASVRARIGYVAQKFSLYGKLTVAQNLRYFGQSFGLTGEALTDRIRDAERIFHLGPYRNERAERLPLGVARDLAFAVATLHHPDILFLDEATSGADVASRRAFWRRIVRLAEQGVTTIVTTHYMDEAHYCDRFLIQDRGRVLVLGSPESVRQGAATPTHPNPTMEEAFIAIVERGRAA